MRTFIPTDAPQRLQALQRWGKLRQEQLSEAVSVTTDTVTEFIKRQIERGDWKTVQDVLHGKPMTKAGTFLLQELRNNVASKLVLKLGLRKVMALGLALVLLPLILAKVAGEIAYRLKRQDKDI
jgi:hypothetical protein